MSISHARDVLLQRSPAVCIDCRLCSLGADINPGRKRHHEILDLGCERIQFRCACRSINRQTLGAALDVG